MATAVDYGVFCSLFRLLDCMALTHATAQKIFPPRTREYAGYPFRDNWTDWYDRLAAPITNYYTIDEIFEWTEKARLKDVRVSLVGDSWIWAIGRRPARNG